MLLILQHPFISCLCRCLLLAEGISSATSGSAVSTNKATYTKEPRLTRMHTRTCRVSHMMCVQSIVVLAAALHVLYAAAQPLLMAATAPVLLDSPQRVQGTDTQTAHELLVYPPQSLVT